jgi:hypothetical protein
LHLGLRGQHHLLVADPLGTEHRRVQAVERVTGTGDIDGSAETAKAQQRRRDRSDNRQRASRFLAVQTLLQCGHRVAGRHRRRHGRVADTVTPVRQQESQFSFGGVGRVDRLIGGERVEETVGLANLVERGVTAVG